jgi:acetyl esterase/lipase
MSDREIDDFRALMASRPRPPDLAGRRQRLDSFGELYPLETDVTLTPVSADGVPAEWSTTPSADTARAILYMHGGAYVAGSTASHRLLVTALGRAAGAQTLAIDYRRAPEHPFPAALDDTLAAYRFLLAEGFAPQDIVIAGDSAGGGLTMGALLALRDAGEPLPGAAFVIAPWVDLACRGESFASKADIDPIIQKPYLLDTAADYIAGADPIPRLASPLGGDFRGLPPVLIQVGSAETLLSDSVALAGQLGEADVAVTLEVWPEMVHVWHLFRGHLSAGGRAIDRAGAFLRGVWEAG